MKDLEKTIGYSFENKDLLNQALTHSSAKNKSHKIDNERLEFLGDRVLGLIIAEILLKKFPSESEGDIAKRHTAFVCKEQLVRIASDISLTDFVIMSAGEEKEGGKINESIMADAVEALLGAMYLDAGIEEPKKFIKQFWDFDKKINPPQDPKTQLQEWAQGNGLGLPIYTLVDRFGSDHKPLFIVKVQIADYDSVKGEGYCKKEAEKAAASKFIEQNI